MAKEIERKFLIDVEKWGRKGTPVEMIQAYLVILPDKIIRVRIAGEGAWLTIKGNTQGITRDEFEYSIPVDDANDLLKMCEDYRVEKTRYVQKIDGKKWEIDVFHGKNEGLIVAELELDSEDDVIVLPEWIICEVSTDEKYYNFNLAIAPFSTWQ
jgi:adenylate cyclase